MLTQINEKPRPHVICMLQHIRGSISGVGAWRPPHTLPPSFVYSIDHIRTPGTATPCHGHYQPRHLPCVVAGLAYDHHGDFERYSCVRVDLLQDTVVQVTSFETKAQPLREEELRFWLCGMAAYGTAGDSAPYYDATLLEHARPGPACIQ